MSEERAGDRNTPGAAKEPPAVFIRSLYRVLARHYGDLRWWPGETPFEVAVGAILTQNTNWRNVEKAIKNLKKENLLSPAAITASENGQLEKALRPSGFYRVKAKRLRAFADYLVRFREGSMEQLMAEEADEIRASLLAIHGIGEETADSIVLYGLGKPVFVVNAYTRRILERHGISVSRESYGSVQRLFVEALPKSASVYNQLHALLVQVGKDYCRKEPRCDGCPLSGMKSPPGAGGRP